VVPRRGGHESVDQSAQFDQPIHVKARAGHDSNRTSFHKGHPLREQRLCPIIWIADDQVPRTSMLSVANNEHRLANQRVKGVGDGGKRQTPGIMNSFPRTAALIIVQKELIGEFKNPGSDPEVRLWSPNFWALPNWLSGAEDELSQPRFR
jgi:hypothetical protein